MHKGIRQGKEIGKRLFAVLASLLLILTTFPMMGGQMVVHAEETATVYVSANGADDDNDGSESSPFATIKKAFGEVTDEGTIVLQSDITLGEQLTLSGEKEVTITSAGEKQSIIRNGSYTGDLMVVSSGANITFEQLIIDGSKVETETNAVITEKNSKAIFNNVVIKNHHTKKNYTLYVSGSNAKMIIGDDTEIKDNKVFGFDAEYPPNVLAAGSGGRLIIEGGEIKENEITSDSNGAIVGLGLNGSPSFIMTGGEITNNQLNGQEFDGNKTVGNVAVNMRGTSAQALFEFGGTAYVYDNINSDGKQRNVFLKNTKARDSAYLSLVSEMEDGANVGVYANMMPSDSDPIVDVAIGYDEYTTTEADAAYFSSDKASKAEISFDEDNNKVILAPIPPTLDSVWLDQTEVNRKDITFTFSDEISLDDLNGFTIKVGDTTVTPEYNVEGNQLILTLTEEPTGNIKLDYTKDNGNLKGTNGMGVEDFDFTYDIDFATSLDITSPESDQTTEKQPEIAGTVTAGSTVNVVIKDNDGNVVENAGGDAKVTDDNWTFTPGVDLDEGNYTVEVTATNSDGKTSVTKTKDITIDTNEYVEYEADSDVSGINPDSITHEEGTFTIPASVTEDTFTFNDGDKEMMATKDDDGDWSFVEEVDYSTDGEVSLIDPEEGIEYKDDKFIIDPDKDINNFTYKDGDKEMKATRGDNGWEFAELVEHQNENEPSDISNGVTYDTDSSKFIVPEDVDSFTYKDGDKEMTATKGEDGTWTFTGTVNVPYTKKDNVDNITPDGITYDEQEKEFTVPSDVAEFTYNDGDKEMKAMKDDDGDWSFVEEVDYSTDGEVSLIDPEEGIEYKDDKFIIDPDKDINNFSYNDGDKEMTATRGDNGWEFAELVDYDTDNEPSDISADGVTYDSEAGEFTVPSNVDEFTFNDGDKEMKATKGSDGKWTFTDESTPAVDKSKLQAQADGADNLKENKYTSASWGTFKDALTTAHGVLNNDDATQEQVDNALEALKDAQNKLEIKDEEPEVDKSALQSAVNEADDLTESDYTPASWAAYQDKLTAAQGILNDPDATQEQVNDAYDALKDAQIALELKDETAGADKSKLQAKADEANDLSEENYTPKSWADYTTALNTAQDVLDNPNATQAEVDQALENLTNAQNALEKKSGLGSLGTSTGNLNPGFTNDHYDYTVNVGNGTDKWTITPDAVHNNAEVVITVNGVVTDGKNMPLDVGANTIVVKVTDETGTKCYTISVNRQSASTGGGGGTVTPPTGDTTENVEVELEIDGDYPIEKTKVTIERTTKADGTVHDKVQLTEDQAQEAVDKAKEIDNDIARILIPDVDDKVDTIRVDIPKAAIGLLADNGLTLEIATENAILTLANTAMDGIDDSFYFDVVPVKDKSEQATIEARAKAEEVVREAMQSDDIHVVARPMTIETNLSSRPVGITLPLNDVVLPKDPAERDTYLQQLGIFIEHTDGEKVVVFPEVVELENGEYGLHFTVDKFSTFTVIDLGEVNTETGEHSPFISGFLDGTFGADLGVTRVQLARMIARNLGYHKEGQANVAPFNDIAKTHPDAAVLAFLKVNGIFDGDEDNNFRPWDHVTRAHMAVIAANLKQLDKQESITEIFADTKGHWAEWAITAVRNANIVNGYADKTFRPDEDISRIHAVLMMNRMFERGPLVGVEKLPFSDINQNYLYFDHVAEAALSHKYVVDKDGNEQLLD